MKATFTKLFSLLAILLFSVQANSQTFTWANNIGGTQGETAYALATDASGNVIIAGYFNGTADFDPSGASSELTSAGLTDIYVAKYTSTGTLLWVKQFGGNDFDVAKAVAVDASGNVYVGGDFWGTADFDPTVSINNITSNGQNDYFLVKLNSSGDVQWVETDGGINNEQVTAITVNSTNEVIVSVYALGGMQIMNYTSGGGQQWVKEVFGAVGYGVATDNANNIFVGGQFSNTSDFNPGAGIENLTSVGWEDAFILKLDASGIFQWVKQISGTDLDQIQSIAVDQVSGSIYITGIFKLTTDFDPDGINIANLTSAGLNDVFVARYDMFGNYVWATRTGSTGQDESWTVSIDPTGVYVSGYFSGTVDFDPDAVNSANLASAGSDDIFVQKLDLNGNYLWAINMGGTTSDKSYASALNSSNEQLYVTGFFTGTADFDPSAGVQNITSFGQEDIFINSVQVAAPAVGISENSSENRISVFPQPASTQITVRAELTENKTGPLIVELFSVKGERVFAQQFQVNQKFQSTISVSEFPAGNYLLQLKSGNKIFDTKKIVVVR